MGAVIEQFNPDNSIFKSEYHLSGKLNKVKLRLRNGSEDKEYVSSISYNAKGQREKIVYGNNTETLYSYERETFRLTNLVTNRTTDNKVLQDLKYFYDPIGNIIKKVDNSETDVYFNNSVVQPINQYTYDALNRLIEANGREHISQGLPPNFTSQIGFRIIKT